MSRILPLPAEAISQIHSSKNITSLQEVVLALLENSMDANATKIEVTVDFSRGGCTVEDDGDGIPSAELGETGGLGKMYHTSKRLANVDKRHGLHGSTGTYLASLASLSVLTISSRQAGSSIAASITMHLGKAISRTTSDQHSDLDTMITSGTQVTVRDLFGNMPVRVKQRALTNESASEDERVWLRLKQSVAALLLAWPRPCSVKLIDSVRKDRRVQLAASHPSTSVSLTSTGLRQLNSGRQSTFRIRETLPIVYQAGLAASESRQAWVPVSASAVDLTVKGLICLSPAPSKQCQFVSLGVHPCATSAGFGDVYDAINKIFMNSSFGSAEDLSEIDEREKDRRERDRRFKGDGYTRKQLHGRKGVDRWPMFILQITFRDRSMCSNASDLNDASLRGVISVLEATVTEWLSAHHFRPRKRTSRKEHQDQQRTVAGLNRRTSSPAPVASDQFNTTGNSSTPFVKATKRQKLVQPVERPRTTEQPVIQGTHGARSPFGLWSRIKSGNRTSRPDSGDARKIVTAPEGQVGSLARPSSNVKRSGFHLPVIEAGSLNSTRSRSVFSNTPIQSSPVAGSIISEPAASSEDFGSFDDKEMEVVAINAEGSPLRVEEDRSLDEQNRDDLVDWVDPRSKQAFKVNSRTGVVLPARPKTAGPVPQCANQRYEGRQPAGIDVTLPLAGRPMSLAKRAAPSLPAADHGDMQEEEQWLPGFLRQWNNPVFVRQDEERIPVALPEGVRLDAEEGTRHQCGLPTGHGDFESTGAKITARLTKASLRSAQVIRQVDRKFILCKLRAGEGSESSNLVLVDQHAASERVVLEDLFTELCTPTKTESASPVRTTMLEKPLRFQVSSQEHELFLKHAERFARWGILCNVRQRDRAVPASQDVRPERQIESILTVMSLPPGIAERCTLVPRILIEMLRAEVWDNAEASKRRDAHPTQSVDEESGNSPHSWLRHIRSCPTGLVDMLNSRACRSAIMFNDELSLEQCEDLMSRLSECAFPFMCAHGRVSMVPLIDLGADSSIGSFGLIGGNRLTEERHAGAEEGYSAAFGKWIGGERSRGRDQDMES